MLHFLKTGHRISCSENPCICASFQFFVTGILALLVGIVQAFVGYYKSMAILSDSLHAIQDSLSDFWGIIVEKRVARNPKNEEVLRKRGDRIIAFLLFIGAIGILRETIERMSANDYLVSLGAVIGVGFLSVIVDLLRWWILYQAQKRSPTRTRAGLILHAKTDAIHGGVITVVGLLSFAAIMLLMMPASYLKPIDLTFSVLLACYMMYLSVGIWKGEHHSHNSEHYNHHDYHY